MNEQLKKFEVLPDSAGISAKVAAELLGVTTVTIWRWAAAGRLTPSRISKRCTRFHVGQIRQLLAGGECNG